MGYVPPPPPRLPEYPQPISFAESSFNVEDAHSARVVAWMLFVAFVTIFGASIIGAVSPLVGLFVFIYGLALSIWLAYDTPLGELMAARRTQPKRKRKRKHSEYDDEWTIGDDGEIEYAIKDKPTDTSYGKITR